MIELSREMKKHVNPRKWRTIHEGWVGNKRTQFPSLTSLTLSTEKMEKLNRAESAVMCSILILYGKKVVKINLESEINHSWDIDGMY